MNYTEREQYAGILMEQLDVDMVLRWLTPQFAEADLERYKITAIGCVRIKNDIDKRMRDFREGPK